MKKSIYLGPLLALATSVAACEEGGREPTDGGAPEASTTQAIEAITGDARIAKHNFSETDKEELYRGWSARVNLDEAESMDILRAAAAYPFSLKAVEIVNAHAFRMTAAKAAQLIKDFPDFSWGDIFVFNGQYPHLTSAQVAPYKDIKIAGRKISAQEIALCIHAQPQVTPKGLNELIAIYKPLVDVEILIGYMAENIKASEMQEFSERTEKGKIYYFPGDYIRVFQKWKMTLAERQKIPRNGANEPIWESNDIDTIKKNNFNLDHVFTLSYNGAIGYPHEGFGVDGALQILAAHIPPTEALGYPPGTTWQNVLIYHKAHKTPVQVLDEACGKSKK